MINVNVYGVLPFLTHGPGEMRLSLNIIDIQKTEFLKMVLPKDYND